MTKKIPNHRCQHWKTLKYNSHIERVVGDGLGGSVALELQKHHPEVKVGTYGGASGWP